MERTNEIKSVMVIKDNFNFDKPFIYINMGQGLGQKRKIQEAFMLVHGVLGKE